MPAASLVPGPWVTEELVKRWGPPGAWLNPSPSDPSHGMGDEEPSGATGVATVPLETAVDEDQTLQEEADVNGLLHVWALPVVGVLGAREPEQPPERVDFFTMARRVVAYLAAQGCAHGGCILSPDGTHLG